MKYWLAGPLLLAAAGMGLTSCEEDIETPKDQNWKGTYVTMQGERLGNDQQKSYTVIETEGLTDATPTTYRFRAAINHVQKSDVVLTLTHKATGGSTNYLEENTVTYSEPKVTIPAGASTSEWVTVSIDPAFLAVVDAQGNYAPTVFTVQFDTVESAPEGVTLSTKNRQIVITLKKTVKPFINIEMGTPANSMLCEDMTGWGGSLGAGVEGSIDKFLSGSEIAANSAPWEFTIDMKEARTITGTQTSSWSAFCPKQVEIFTSDDNSSWKSHGSISTSGGTQNIRFLKPVTSRYIRYVVQAPNSRAHITKFRVYVPNN